MSECIHGMESGCTICRDQAGELKPYGKVLDLSAAAEIPGRQVPHDPEVALAMAAAAGVICPICLTDLPRKVGKPGDKTGEWSDIIGRGCHCQRRAMYDDDMDEAKRFLARAADEAGLTPKEAAGMAFSTMSRAARLGSLTDDDKTADRLDIIEQFEVKPQYLKARRTEQNILPI